MSMTETGTETDGPPALARELPSAKRVFDVAVSSSALLVASPILVAIALAVKLTSPGPALFVQERYGRGKRTFSCLKFRTMARCETTDEFVQATRNDNRVTPVGRLLRKTSHDELPQLFNVLTGSMSLVGPRPHPLRLDDTYSPKIANYDERFAVSPGITGLAQVRGHRGPTPDVATMALRVESDREYVRRYSFLLDLTIIARTIPSLLGAKNAH